MGSASSTRWRHHTARTCVDEAYRLDAKTAAVAFSFEKSFGQFICLSKEIRCLLFVGYSASAYQYEDDPVEYRLFLKLPFRQVLELEPVAMRVGGRRWMFRCPFCKKKAASLYILPGSTEFGCRTCLDLTYPSTLKRERKSLYLPMVINSPQADVPARRKRRFI